MLKDRLAGQVQNEDKTGPKPYLDQSEEKKFGDFCNSALQFSMGRHADVMAIAQSFASLKGVLRNERIRQGWFHRFLGGHENLALRRRDSTTHSRMNAMNTKKSTSTLELDVVSRPTQVYRVNETEMPLDPKALNVIAERDMKKVGYS